MAPKNKLWQNQTSLHPLVESYTVGEDYLLDLKLLPYDVKASLAHAAMLNKTGVLNTIELKQLQAGLREILSLWQAGKFVITQDQEDGHTAIENYLTDKYGEVGKKIHTGRSRNDIRRDNWHHLLLQHASIHNLDHHRCASLRCFDKAHS